MRSPGQRTWRATVFVCLALVALLLSACTGGTQSTTIGTQSSAAPTSSGPDPAVVSAEIAAMQYDYDGAIATLSAIDSDEARDALAQVEAAKATAVQWADNTTIPHLFYHSLVVDPQRAFGDGAQGVGFSQYMVTIDEFNKQLQQMYDGGWVMVHPERIAAPDANGVMTMQPIVLPPGKKPFVLSLDDLSYYEYMTGLGFPTNLVVQDDGTVANTYTDASGKTTVGNYDCVPIIDAFVREHPDFSYRGDKGSIALTGYNGILGYRSSVQSYGDNPTTQAEQQKAKVVADAIKANGWNFASHSWGHINFTNKDLGWITEDSKKWSDEVRSLVGDTPEFIYPFGADISDAKAYTSANGKFTFLHDQQNFSYFFGVDGVSPHWVQLGPNYLRQARINVDGLSMQRVLDGKNSALTQFFDVPSTLDPKRPLPVPSVGGPGAGGN